MEDKKECSNKINKNITERSITNTGITLITMVITIVILIILASIVIYFTLGNNGIIKKAKEASEKWKTMQQQELSGLNELDKYFGTEGGSFSYSESNSNDIKSFTPIIKECNGDYIEIELPEIEVINSNSIVGYAYLLNGEVVEYTKEKGYIYKNLELDSNYDIKVIAMDKKGKIKISNNVNKQTSNKLEIYNSGNEYKNITGGWKGISVSGYGTGYGQYSKTNEYMYVKNTSTNPHISSNYYPSWVTSKPINISKYSKLVAEREFITPSKGTNKLVNRLIITTDSEKYTNGTWANSSITENATKMELDLSNIDEKLREAYIALTAQNSNYNEHTEMTIRKVWLEK